MSSDWSEWGVLFVYFLCIIYLRMKQAVVSGGHMYLCPYSSRGFRSIFRFLLILLFAVVEMNYCLLTCFSFVVHMFVSIYHFCSGG